MTTDSGKSFSRSLVLSTPWIVWPLLSFGAWMATILGLLLWWTAIDDAKGYHPDQATIVYVSDVGAQHQSLFVAGSALTALFYVWTLVLARWLRHLRRLPGNVRRREAWAAGGSVVAGIFGALFLVLLSAFNNQSFGTAHWVFALLFLIFTGASAVLQYIEIAFLARSHTDRKHLRRNAVIKLWVIGLAFVGASGFIVTYAIGRSKWRHKPDTATPTGSANVLKSIAACFEWTVAFIFGAYLLTFVLDLWPASKTKGLRLTRSLLESDRTPKPDKTRTAPALEMVQSGERLPSVVRWNEEERTLGGESSAGAREGTT